jgi:hypothetical protein
MISLSGRVRRWFLLIACAVVTATAAPALCEEASDRSSDGSSGWEFTVTPYVWFMDTDGEITADGVSTNVDMAFSEVLSQLNYGFIGAFEARNGRWMVVLDAFYANLEDDFNAGPASIDQEVDQLLLGGMLGYRVLSRTVRAAFLRPFGLEQVGLSCDLLAGGRYWNINQEIDVTIPGLTVNSDSSEHWLDALVGTRLRAALTDRISLTGIFDIGGFGIGSASDTVWHWALTLDYRFRERWTLLTGFRFLSLDQADGSGTNRVETNVKMTGPVVGVSYRF